MMQDRVDMKQSPAVPLLSHCHMLLLMALLFLCRAVAVSLVKGPSVLAPFASAHLVLASTVCSIFAKYALQLTLRL
jgi:hypothetical protein